MLSDSSHMFSELFYHLNWHCKNDMGMLQGSLEGAVHRFIEQYCHKSKGVRFYGIGGIEDHIHLVIEGDSTLVLNEWVGKVKGACSHEMNQRWGHIVLQWQRGGGVVSFAKRDLPAVLRYVAHQREHHESGTTREALERHGVEPQEGQGGEQEMDQPSDQKQA